MARATYDGEYKGGVPSHFNGSVDIEHKVITFNPTVSKVIIQNKNAVQQLFVSFNSGTNFFQVYSGLPLDLDNIGIDNVVLSGSAATTYYEIIAVE